MIETFSVASLHLAFRHFGTRETLGCSRVGKSRVQKVKLRHSSGNSTHSGETPLTIVATRVRRELGQRENVPDPSYPIYVANKVGPTR